MHRHYWPVDRNTYGLWFYTLVLCLYLLFLSCMTYFVVSHNSLRHYDTGDLDNKTMDMLHGNNKVYSEVSIDSMLSCR